jgi:hypothetical protein
LVWSSRDYGPTGVQKIEKTIGSMKKDLQLKNCHDGKAKDERPCRATHEDNVHPQQGKTLDYPGNDLSCVRLSIFGTYFVSALLDRSASCIRNQGVCLSSGRMLSGGAWKMRKSLWIILAVLVVAICAPAVMADTINGEINFTVSGIPLLPTGSFVFDTSTDSFTSFTVVWAGVGFDLTAAANSYAVPNGCGGVGMFIQVLTSPSCSPGNWGAHLDPFSAWFQFRAASNSYIQANAVLNGNGTVEDTGGTFTVTTTATPEPSVLAFTLVGIGLFWLLAGMRKHPCLRLRKSS